MGGPAPQERRHHAVRRREPRPHAPQVSALRLLHTQDEKVHTLPLPGPAHQLIILIVHAKAGMLVGTPMLGTYTHRLACAALWYQ